jgi:hypothetical protein
MKVKYQVTVAFGGGFVSSGIVSYQKHFLLLLCLNNLQGTLKVTAVKCVMSNKS